MSAIAGKFESLNSSSLFSSSDLGLASFQKRLSHGILELPKSPIDISKIFH